uniref:DENN domain containing 3 n=1 Tax=Amphiprion percula TaxID=161767 RepID=A0A3P8RL49_AMPPE
SGLVSAMADYLPAALLEACVVVGASSDKLQEVYQVLYNGTPELPLLEPEVLHVLVPPFVSRPQAESETLRPRGKRRRSFLRKKREQLPSSAPTPGTENVLVYSQIQTFMNNECIIVFLPGGLQVTSEQKDEEFHFLVFTNVFGNKTHGVVMQCYRPIQEGTSFYQNGADSSKLFSAYSFCVISKYPFFTALKDCLSW